MVIRRLRARRRPGCLHVSLIVTAKMNDIDPQASLADVLARLPNTMASHVPDLLPWNWQQSEHQIAA